jgi:flagellar hook-associated protein 1 FlgK
MSDLLNVGSRALLANQIALQTTGNNISNVNTPGYSRQTTVMQAVQGQFTGAGYIGNGVAVQTVQRVYSDFLTKQAHATLSISSSATAVANQMNQLQNLFPGGDNGLGASISNMINDFSDVSSAPTDLTARTVAITQAQQVATNFQGAATQLNTLQQNNLSQLSNDIAQINTYAQQLASVNGQVAAAIGSGQPPNTLLDQRDQILSDLNKLVQTSTVKADDGTLSVFIGSQPLVLGTTASTVSQSRDQFNNPNSVELSIQRGPVTNVMDPSTLGGGEVSGLISFQNNNLSEASNLLGRLALAVNTSINQQHEVGLNLNGVSGQALFTPITLTGGYPSSSNNPASTGAIAVTVADPTKFSPSNYQVSFGAGSVTVTRLSDNTATTFAGPPASVTVDGLNMAISGSTSAGDTFLIKPFETAASSMVMAISSPTDLAVGNPVQAAPATSNKGTVSVSALSANPANPANANLTQTVTLTFNGANTFDVTGTGTGNPTGVTYVPGQAISYNGWTLNLTGAPQNGDTLVVQAANPNFLSTNGGNATALLNAGSVPTFDGSAMTDGYANLMAQIGVQTQSAQYAASVAGTISSNSASAQASVSGVNLDEEAAKLLQNQQAYQAAAKIIQAAQSTWSTLMSTVSSA